MRQIVLDTETTGLDTAEGHRVIEIGCVEILNRRISGNTFHQYIQPDRGIDGAAVEVHGITDGFLADKPRFTDIAQEFLKFITGAELIIHNAPFDVGFLDYELSLLATPCGRIAELCAVVDTLAMARRLHPGQKNSLDALCRRYRIDNSHRELHGALLDAEILADVYLAMTGGQVALSLQEDADAAGQQTVQLRRLPAGRPPLRVITASPDELAAHGQRLDAVEKACGAPSVWRRMEGDEQRGTPDGC
jgi:DNA polymerase-3 subunit epsilon